MSCQEKKVAAHARARSREAPPPCSPRHTMIGDASALSLWWVYFWCRRQLQPTMTLTLRTKTTAIGRIPVWMTPMTRRQARNMNGAPGNISTAEKAKTTESGCQVLFALSICPPPPTCCTHAICTLPLHSFRFVFSDRTRPGAGIKLPDVSKIERDRKAAKKPPVGVRGRQSVSRQTAETKVVPPHPAPLAQHYRHTPHSSVSPSRARLMMECLPPNVSLGRGQLGAR